MYRGVCVCTWMRDVSRSVRDAVGGGGARASARRRTGRGGRASSRAPGTRASSSWRRRIPSTAGTRAAASPPPAPRVRAQPQVLAAVVLAVAVFAREAPRAAALGRCESHHATMNRLTASSAALPSWCPWLCFFQERCSRAAAWRRRRRPAGRRGGRRSRPGGSGRARGAPGVA